MPLAPMFLLRGLFKSRDFTRIAAAMRQPLPGKTIGGGMKKAKKC